MSSQTAETLHDAGKLQVADAARLLGDNQTTLNHVNAEDARLRDLHGRIQEAEARKQHPELAPPAASTEDQEMKINIDSPVTVNHNYPETSSPADPPHGQPVHRGLLSKAAPLLLAGALGASGVGLPLAVSYALGMFDKPAASVDTDTQYMIRLPGGE